MSPKSRKRAYSGQQNYDKKISRVARIYKSFGFETTASGKNYVKDLQEAKAKKHQIHLIFLWLSSPELAIKRVAERVKQGGHNIPSDTITNRYYLGIKNLLNHYIPLANTVLILDNSFAIENKKIIASKNTDTKLQIQDGKIWKEMQELAND